MKNHILFITVSIMLFTFWGVANAQLNQIGLIGGINIANVDEKDKDEDYNSRTVLGLGGIVEFGIGEKFSICFEPMYLQKGAREEEHGTTADIKLAYLEIPVFFKLPFGTSSTRPYIMAGPTLGIRVSAKVKKSIPGMGIEADIKDVIKSIDYGLGFGGGVNFPIGNNKLFIEARYTLGLADIAKEGETEIGEVYPYTEIKTRGIQIMAGISMPFGGK